MALQGLVREHDLAGAVDQRDPVDHRVEGPAPALAEPAHPVGEVVDRHQQPGRAVVAGRPHVELDLRLLAAGQQPARLDHRLLGQVGRHQARRQLVLRDARDVAVDRPPGRGLGHAAEEAHGRRVGAADHEAFVELEQRRRRGREQLAVAPLRGGQRPALLGQALAHVVEGLGELSHLADAARLEPQPRGPVRVEGPHPVRQRPQRLDDARHQRQPDHQGEGQGQAERGHQPHRRAGELALDARPRHQQHHVDGVAAPPGPAPDLHRLVDPQQLEVERQRLVERRPVAPEHLAAAGPRLTGPQVAGRDHAQVLG